MKTGNTTTDIYPYPPEEEASMEPGHEDREYRANTHTNQKHQNASMEPGHEDREYRQDARRGSQDRYASMEPGHEDREYRT